jgi:short subunit dehydrogenase-like uncharacterized protein
MRTAARRIVVFGATGLTGRLVAAALLRRGARPVLAGRDRARLEAVGEKLGGRLATRVAAAEDSPSLRSALEGGDVLVTTVGPFHRLGDGPARAAVDAGAHYLDSAGEPPFTRRVFDRYGADAESAGIAMLTAFGPEWVLGNVAGALALARAGEDAVRVDTGYFIVRPSTSSPIGIGLLASMFAAGSFASGPGLLGEGFAWRDGRLVTERWARRSRSFDVAGRRLPALSTGGSEHFGLPRAFPRLREVNVYLGWFSYLSPVVRAVSLVGAPVLRVPAARRSLQHVVHLTTGSASGPSESRRDRVRSLTVGAAYDAAGRELARTLLQGPDLHTLTGELLAWGAMRAAGGGLRGTGALGPLDAFGLEALEEACASAGVTVREASPEEKR